MTDSRHAYLIIAHNNFEMLRMLIQSLDDPRNDLYVHVDAKCKDYDSRFLEGLVTKATLIQVDRIPVYWGGHSQIAVELLLLEAATKTPHAYYHLLSGVDIPLKTQDEIHRFFRENDGTEYVGIDAVSMETRNFAYRYEYYHIFPKAEVRSKKPKDLFMRLCRKVFLYMQKFVRVDRSKKTSLQYYKGANWFSITHGLACHVLEQQSMIKKIFSYSHCGDEVFLQTVAMASDYKDRVCGKTLRLTDWQRGSPYTFREEDYDMIVNSDQLFARKFDYKTDPVIVDKLYARLKGSPNL